MSIKDGQTTFLLSRPIKYSRGGNSQVEATTVTLIEPGMEHAKFYLKLRQMLMRCQIEFAKEQKVIGEEQKPLHQDTERIESETDELTDVFSIALMASNTVDVSVFLDTFRNMVTIKHANKPVCLLDSTQPITDALWERIYPDDAFNMAVRWCVFFGMPSVEKEKTTSGQPSGSPTGPMEA